MSTCQISQTGPRSARGQREIRALFPCDSTPELMQKMQTLQLIAANAVSTGLDVRVSGTLNKELSCYFRGSLWSNTASATGMELLSAALH